MDRETAAEDLTRQAIRAFKMEDDPAWIEWCEKLGQEIKRRQDEATGDLGVPPDLLNPPRGNADDCAERGW